MNQKVLQQTLEFTEDIALQVARFLGENQKKVSILNYKDRQDVQTSADIAAEKMFIDAIEKQFPSHSILSEERGFIDKHSDYRWVMDPLDGTKEYIRNIPLFSTVIALEYKEEMIISLVNHVSNSLDTFSAAKGLGAFRNHQSIKVSEQNDLGKSYLYYHSPNYTVEEKYANEFWKKIQVLSRSCYRIRGMAHENIILGWLASGGAEAYVYFGGKAKKKPQWYDVAPGLLIAQEAGGKCTDLKGNNIIHDDLDNGIIVTNGLIHEELTDLLNS